MLHRDPPAAVLDNALDAILITEADLELPGPRIVYVNDAFCRLCGYTRAEVVGNTPRMFQGPGSSRAVLDELRRALAAGQPFLGHTTNYRKDGTAFEIEWRIAAVRGTDGSTTQYLSIHRDVTGAGGFERNIEEYVARLLDEQHRSAIRQVELETTNAQLRQLATTDGLTGLFNHRHFFEELARLDEQTSVLSLLMIDVDHFKSFNDEFGHPEGDRVLQQIARAIQSAAGPAVACSRYGGEEFAVLLPEFDADAALAVAERLRLAVEAGRSPFRSLTVSIGVSTRSKSGPSSARTLLNQADAALYAAKAAGRNRVSHDRHNTSAKARLGSTNVGTGGCATPCAPSPAGCLRCETMPSSSQGASLLFAPRDADATNTLTTLLTEAGFAFESAGPVMLLHDVKARLHEIESLFKKRVSPITMSSVVGAYVPAGLRSSEQIMRALMIAQPLSSFVDNLQHEWIREALSDGWLFSVFHPIIDARSGGLFAQEALLRARHAVTGQTLGAGQIINACEVLSLQHQLDQRARQAAIRGAAEHVAAGCKIFINFLPNTIYDPAICLRTTMETAAECNISMDRLVFEVVETEKIPDMEHLHRVLQYYRERGVGTAIDDMGAGFTTLDYITSLKPNFVKLDREFVLTAEATAAGRAQLHRIVGASHEQGARVIAEGIETTAQMNLCIDENVDLLQGFLFAKPACPPQAVNFPTSFKRVA